MTRFDRFSRQIRAGSNGPLKGVYTKWGVRYLAWTKRLFVKSSRGGGDWPDLAPSTKAARRAGPRRHRKRRGRGYRKRGPTSYAILRDTGMLLKALDIGAPGNLFKMLRKGVRIGFGGPAKHPEGGRATIADIAKFHQTGGRKKGGRKGRLPKREILHVPDEKLKAAMMRDLRLGIERLGKGLGGGK